MANIVRNGDFAIWHTDVLGNPVTGIIVSSSKVKCIGVDVSHDGDFVLFPLHPHQIVLGSPTDYRSHVVPVQGTGKLTIVGEEVVLQNDLVPVADIAGWNAFMQASQTKFWSI